MNSLQKISSSKIFSLTESGVFIEYDKLPQAIAANGLAVIKQEKGIVSSLYPIEEYRYTFPQSGKEGNYEFNQKDWIFRIRHILNATQFNHSVAISIIDKHGIIRHNSSKKYHLESLAESLMEFVSLTKYSDWKEVDARKLEERHNEEKKHLQQQIDELRDELKQIKEQLLVSK